MNLFAIRKSPVIRTILLGKSYFCRHLSGNSTARRLLACALIACMVPAIPASAREANIITLSADNTRLYPDDKITAHGNVRAVYADYTVAADSAEADLQTNVAVFLGNVRLATQHHEVTGENLTINLKTRDWSLENAVSQVEPGTWEGQTYGTAYLRSASISGRDESLRLCTGTFTTCDLDHPHYFLSAGEMEIHPDVKIVARRVSMIGLDRRLFTLNSLTIPIRGFRHNLIPQVGQSVDEGMFLKAAYPYSMTETSQGFLKLDLMEKRGIGTGIEHMYKLGGGSGEALLYYLADQAIGGSNITGRIRHQQKLGAVDLNLTGDYRTNNYLYFPTSTSQNWQAALRHGSPSANTSLVMRRNATSGVGTSDTFTSSLRHTQQFNSQLSGLFSADLRRFVRSGMEASDRDLDTLMELRHRADKYDLSLIASKKFDLDDLEGRFFSNLDRLPELTFSTDSYRLGEGLFLGLPSRIQLSYGRYHEMPADVESGRLLFQWDMLGRSFDLGDRTDVNLNAGFRQAHYAGDAMQHVLKGGGVLTTRFNDYLRTRVTYNYQDAQGFSPFRFDYTGKYNYTRAVIDYQDNRRLRWSLSSGYDLKRPTNNWQDIAIRLTANPTDRHSFAFSTGYDLNNSRWRTLISQFRVNEPGRLSLDVGARYDLATGKLNLARGRIDYRINDLWRLEGITSWTGAAKKFDYQAFRLTRDLHCWEVSLTYNEESGFRRDKGLSLDFRIKAFPRQDRFGIGQFGQAVDTSVGQFFY